MVRAVRRLTRGETFLAVVGMLGAVAVLFAGVTGRAVTVPDPTPISPETVPGGLLGELAIFAVFMALALLLVARDPSARRRFREWWTRAGVE